MKANKNSSIYRHFSSTDHKIDNTHFKIIDKRENQYITPIKQAVHIKYAHRTGVCHFDSKLMEQF